MRAKNLIAPAALALAVTGSGWGVDAAEAKNDFARNSLASPLVQNRTQMRIYKIDDPEDIACADRKFVSTALVLPPKTTHTEAGPVRKWQEQWILDRCGQQIDYRVFYTEIGQGGISFSVANAATLPAAVKPAEPPPVAMTRVLTVTSPLTRGEDVRAVQRALAAEDIDVSADGIYGPSTRQAVIAFQKSKGLAPDGQVGAKTRAALGL